MSPGYNLNWCSPGYNFNWCHLVVRANCIRSLLCGDDHSPQCRHFSSRKFLWKHWIAFHLQLIADCVGCTARKQAATSLSGSRARSRTPISSWDGSHSSASLHKFQTKLCPKRLLSLGCMAETEAEKEEECDCCIHLPVYNWGMHESCTHCTLHTEHGLQAGFYNNIINNLVLTSFWPK